MTASTTNGGYKTLSATKQIQLPRSIAESIVNPSTGSISQHVLPISTKHYIELSIGSVAQQLQEQKHKITQSNVCTTQRTKALTVSTKRQIKQSSSTSQQIEMSIESLGQNVCTESTKRPNPEEKKHKW